MVNYSRWSLRNIALCLILSVVLAFLAVISKPLRPLPRVQDSNHVGGRDTPAIKLKTQQWHQRHKTIALQNARSSNTRAESWVCTWPGCLPAVVSLTFDDGRWSALELGGRMLSAHNLRGTFYIVTDRMKRRGEEYKQQLLKLLAQGHEIGGHTTSHVHLLNRTYPEKLHVGYARQISECADELRRTFGDLRNSSLSFAYPYGSGSHSLTIRQAVGQSYIAARGLDADINWSCMPRKNLLNLRTITWVSKTTTSEILRWTKTIVHAGTASAKNGIAQTRSWLILTGHGVRRANTSTYARSEDHSEEGYEPAMEGEFDKFLQHVEELQRTELLWVAPLGHVTRFIKTRNAVEKLRSRVVWQGSLRELCTAAVKGHAILRGSVLIKDQCFNRRTNEIQPSTKSSDEQIMSVDGITCRLLKVMVYTNRTLDAPIDHYPITVRTMSHIPPSSPCYSTLKVMHTSSIQEAMNPNHTAAADGNATHCVVLNGNRSGSGREEGNHAFNKSSCWCKSGYDRVYGTVSWTCTVSNIMLNSLSVSSLLFDTVHILACYKEHDCSMLSIQS